MSIFEGIILGLVQGITEFLPISSSGHLIIARNLFGVSDVHGLTIDAVLQLATALAVLVFFRFDFIELGKNVYRLCKRKTIDSEQKIMIQVLGIGTIPAVLFGILLESAMETVFRNAILVSGALVIGSLLMLTAERFYSGKALLATKMALPLGLFQSLALIPGISRSGATISGAMLLGLGRETATRVSFMLSVPILVGSGIKKVIELVSSQIVNLESSIIVAFLVSFFVGLFVIRFLLQYLKQGTLYPFIVYRLILASIIFVHALIS